MKQMKFQIVVLLLIFKNEKKEFRDLAFTGYSI